MDVNIIIIVILSFVLIILYGAWQYEVENNGDYKVKYYVLSKKLLETKSGVLYLNSHKDDILDAIKIAMKVSHPDNGGNIEEFVKYRNLQSSLKELL